MFKLNVTLDGNHFDAEADQFPAGGQTTADNPLVSLFRTWINAQNRDAANIEHITDAVRVQNDGLEAAVHAVNNATQQPGD